MQTMLSFNCLLVNCFIFFVISQFYFAKLRLLDCCLLFPAQVALGRIASPSHSFVACRFLVAFRVASLVSRRFLPFESSYMTACKLPCYLISLTELLNLCIV